MIDQITIESESRGTIEMVRGTRLGYYLDDVEFAKPDVNHNTYSYSNQVGASIASTSVGERDITIRGYVLEIGQNTLQDRCDALNDYFSPLEDYTLHYKGWKMKFRPDGPIIWAREFKSNNMGGRSFMLQATAAFPLFSKTENTAVTFDSEEKLFHFPTSFGSDTPFAFSVTSEVYGVDVFNDGGADTGIIGQITFTGSVTNPRLVNRTLGKYVGVNHTFAAGEVLEISTISGDKHITLIDSGGQTVNLMKKRDVGTTWWQLIPGINAVSFTCEDVTEIGSMSVVLYYAPLRWEVE